jgi:hypothetical protein
VNGWAVAPRVPSDLEAKVGYHLDTTDPSTHALVFGDRQQKTTAIKRDLGLAWPLGDATSPADAPEGSTCIEPRTAIQ